MDAIISNLPLQLGALGVLVVILLGANVAQWTRANKKDEDMSKERRDWFEQSVETTAALVELNVLFRSQKK